MTDMILTWILFGGAVGFMANFLEFFSDEQKTITSVILGVIGGIIGGVLGESILSINPSTLMTPLIYTVLGALLLVMLPIQNKILD